MKRALDNLMHQGPAWLLTKQIEKHPANGKEQALRHIRKTWPTTQNLSSYNLVDIVYTDLNVVQNNDVYYMIVNFTTKHSSGHCVLYEHLNAWNWQNT